MEFKEYLSKKFAKKKTQEVQTEVVDAAEVDNAEVEVTKVAEPVKEPTKKQLRDAIEYLASIWTGTKEAFSDFVDRNSSTIKKAAALGTTGLLVLTLTGCSAGMEWDGSFDIWFDWNGGRPAHCEHGEMPSQNIGKPGTDGDFYFGGDENDYYGDWVGDGVVSGGDNTHTGRDPSDSYGDPVTGGDTYVGEWVGDGIVIGGDGTGGDGGTGGEGGTGGGSDIVIPEETVPEQPSTGNKIPSNLCYVDLLATYYRGREAHVASIKVAVDANNEVDVVDMELRGRNGKWVTWICTMTDGTTMNISVPLECNHLVNGGNTTGNVGKSGVHADGDGHNFEAAAKSVLATYGVSAEEIIQGILGGEGLGLGH